ncbi:MAG: ABC transporter ATP-binding protein [Dehalococcoidia bacterium]|nr:ABC transporter ATP-binding protein [Dehalococcoidia bacterium]
MHTATATAAPAVPHLRLVERADAVAATGLVKTYNGAASPVPALRGVDLRVERGEMVAIMGPSGCGKTTLLNCISGLDTFDSGSVAIDGVDISTMADYQRTAYRAEKMGFVFQTYNLLPVLSAVENVELPLVVSGTNPREARRQAMEALARVNLRDKAHARPSQLSGGQRQRVTVARALVNNPAIVFADEPTGALDSATANEIMALMEELHAAGHTFVIVTHDPAIAARCDRVIQMRDGRIVSDERTR